MPIATPTNETFSNESIETILNIFRHLNPSETEKNLKLLSEALPTEITESLKEIIDVPSTVIVASEANNREFLSYPMARENKCGKCYRCPWDNKMYTVEGIVCCQTDHSEKVPSDLKQLEVSLNAAVNTYASLYYGTDAISSVYVNGKDCKEFSVAVLIKKSAEIDDDDNNSSSKATWDSVHSIEIEEEKGSDNNFIYRHTCTVMLSFDNSVESLKNIKLTGNLIRQNELKFLTLPEKHLINIGGMLEECESRLRNDMQSVYFGRTHDIVNELRSAMPDGFLRNQSDFRDEMLAKLKGRE